MITSASSLIILFIPIAACLEYDFIIVGGGTAGLTLARRLSETGQYTVLVIETGGFPKNGSDVPALAETFFDDPEVAYQYNTVPQKNAGLRNGGIITLFAGKMLGGTSSLNLMWWNRGNPHDYNNWAKLTGDDSWNYANMLKYFKKSEGYVGEFPSRQHGFSGPITISQPEYSPGLEYWLEAGRWLGYKTADPNGPQTISFTPVEFSKRHGRRVSSWTGYIVPVLDSLPNLTIITNTNATKIVFDSNNTRAIGVRIKSAMPELQNLSDDVIYAKNEIIICAGALGSPILLQRSGIGPKEVLEEAGIPVLNHLPVGLNLQAHPALPLFFSINDSFAVIDPGRDLNPIEWDYYNRFGDGPYSNTAGATGQAWVSSSVAKSKGEDNWADLQLAMSHSISPYVGSIEDVEAISATLKPEETLISASVWLMRPNSSGSIKINPKDHFGDPIIDLQYLSEPDDITAMIDGIKETMKVFETTPAYQSLGARFKRVSLPACDTHKFRSKSYWTCYVKQITPMSACHQAGSCAMGSVVDSELNVIGINGLRVVGAANSINIANANLQASVYAISEKAAEIILKDYDEGHQSKGDKDKSCVVLKIKKRKRNATTKSKITREKDSKNLSKHHTWHWHAIAKLLICLLRET